MIGEFAAVVFPAAIAFADGSAVEDDLEAATQITQVFIIVGLLAMAGSFLVWQKRNKKP